MEFFRFDIHKPRSVYVTTEIQTAEGRLCVSYETVNCLGHKTDLENFSCLMNEILQKRRCLKMFWSLVDVSFMIVLLGINGFFCWLLTGPWQGIADGEVIGFYGMLIGVTVLFFALRFTQTIELTLMDGSVRLIPVSAFLLGPFNRQQRDKISGFCEQIQLDM